MKFKLIGISIIIIITSTLYSGVNFDNYFENSTMRIDYYHVGDKNEDIVSIDLIYKEGEWAGNPNSLFDDFNNGKYYHKIYDAESNTLIYSKGFSNFFAEYQTTSKAAEGIKRAYHETALIPYPKKEIIWVLEKRNYQNELETLFKKKIDPSDYHIITQKTRTKDYIIKGSKNYDPHNTVDIVLVGEGYTKGEKSKFKSDVKRYTEEIFSIEPFKSNRDKINVRGILRYSVENGVDQPRKGIYKNSILNASFNTFDSDRYLLTENNKILHDITSQVPCDAIIILANVKRYGGGGIYNFYAISTANEEAWNDYVFLHEFGHSFAGLADEYYSSDVAYDDFYPKGQEPCEPNITALLDPDNLKWKDQMSPDLEIPTDWGQDKYEGMGKQINELYSERSTKLSNTNEEHTAEIEQIKSEYSSKISKLRKEMKDFMTNHPHKGKIGVFEGAGYNAKGLYRPTLNSIMHQFTKEDKKFYKVNEDAIQKTIDYYTK